MGLRTLNHLIEDESRQYFRSLLPRYWVYRNKEEDYGIDCEVEIFDENGNPTGLVFWVQLKGTASKDISNIQSFRFINDKLDQFRNYDIPVLIVRYSSYTKTLYFKWAKSVFRLNRSAKSTNVFFLENDLWNDNSPENILNYLKKQIAIKQVALRFPIKTFIKRRSANLTTTVPYSNLVLVKNYLTTSSYFTISNIEEDCVLQVIVEKSQIIFSFTDLAFSSIGIDFSDLNAQIDETTLKYILLAFSASLFEINRSDLCGIVFFDNDLFQVAKKDTAYLSRFLPHLLNGPNFIRTMHLLNKFLVEEEQNDNFLHLTMHMILFAERDNLDDEQTELVEKFFLLNLEQAKKWENAIGIGTAYYNLGSFYRGLGNCESALSCYLEARRYKPGYKKHHYYLHEIAGLLFILGRYRFAEIFYRKSNELYPEGFMVKGLIADCLICAGEYKLAVSELDEFLTERHDKIENLDEWYLKYSCLKSLINDGYPTTQKRDSEKADRLASEGKNHDALLADLLCPLAWFNSGIECAKTKREIDAFIAFSMAGMICNKDLIAWANATLFGFQEGIPNILLENVIKTAHFYNGQDYINTIFDVISKTQPEKTDQIMEFLDRTLPKTSNRPLSIRLFEDEQKYTYINLRR